MNKKSLIIFIFIFAFALFLVLFSIFLKSKDTEKNINSGTIFEGSITKQTEKKLVLTFIEDKRNPETNLDSYFEELKKNVLEVKNAEIKKLDFSDDLVQNYMKKNSIKFLPAIIFSTNDLQDNLENPNLSVKKYLTKMESGEYFLDMGAFYNPFLASERGFQVLDKNILNEIKNDSFFENGNDKKIIWLEYGDLSCSFCQKFHNSGIIEKILKEFEGEISKIYNHFVVHEGKHFETLECLAEQKGKDGFFKFLNIFYNDNVYKFEDLALRLEKDAYDLKKIEECISEGKFIEKVSKQSKRASEIFGVNVTPTSVFINSETGEYKIISGFDAKNAEKTYLEIINSLK